MRPADAATTTGDHGERWPAAAMLRNQDLLALLSTWYGKLHVARSAGTDARALAVVVVGCRS
jgi:hypothetical protein